MEAGWTVWPGSKSKSRSRSRSWSSEWEESGRADGGKGDAEQKYKPKRGEGGKGSDVSLINKRHQVRPPTASLTP